MPLRSLPSAKLNGADVPDKAIEDAVESLYGDFSEKNGHFGYSSLHNEKDLLTGMELLFWEHGGRPGKFSPIKAADFILEAFRSFERAQLEF